MKKLILILVCFALCFTFVFGFTACKKQSSQTTAFHAKVGTWKTAQTIQPFFYENYLEPEDRVEITPFTNPGDMKTALLAGSLDLCGTTMVTAITAAAKGEPIVVVSGLSNKCSALVVGKNSNINKPMDLKGKKIAYVPGTMHHLLLLEALSHSGIDPQKDVELIRIDFFDMGQALAQGTVDAFYSGEPYPSIAVAQGYGKVLLYPNDNEGFGIINSAMITTKEKIKNDPEIIQKLVNAHVKATEALIQDKETWMNKAAEFGTDKEVLNVASSNIQLFWDIDENYLTSVENLAERMKEQGLITEIPDIHAMFDLNFIQEAKRELE